MRYRAWEKYNLVLLRHNGLIAALVSAGRVIQTQLASFEWTRLSVKEVDKCNAPRSDRLLRIVAVNAKEIPIIAGGDLRLDMRDGKLLDSQLIQYSWKHTPDSFQNDSLMLSQIHEHSRTAV